MSQQVSTQLNTCDVLKTLYSFFNVYWDKRPSQIAALHLCESCFFYII